MIRQRAQYGTTQLQLVSIVATQAIAAYPA